MRIAELRIWRDRFKRAETIREMKAVGRDFKEKFSPPIQDHEILTVLRDHEEFFQLLSEVIE